MKRLIIGAGTLMILAVSLSSAYALSPSLISSTTLRNSIAYNWSYWARGYYENNCLAFALGNYTDWVWPWGSANPTLAVANNYMATKGYTAVSANATGPLKTTRAYAYGSSSGVTHFAKNTTATTTLRYDKIRAKWGRYETFDHSNANPYKPSPYGPLVGGYVK